MHVNHNFDFDRFRQWVEAMSYFQMWSEENDEVGMYWIVEGVCRTEEAAEVVRESYLEYAEETGAQVKMGTRVDIDYKRFLEKLETDHCVAVFDVEEGPDPEDPDSEETFLFPSDERGLPLAVILADDTNILNLVDCIEKHERTAILEEPRNRASRS